MKNLNTLEILNNFKLEKPKKRIFGNYRIEGNELVYRAQRSREIRLNKLNEDTVETLRKLVKAEMIASDAKLVKNRAEETATLETIDSKEKDFFGYYMLITFNEENLIAKKITDKGGKQLLLGNSSILPLVGRTVAYGNESLNRNVTEIQESMARDNTFILVPFVVFSQAKLDLEKFELIERAKEETIKVKHIKSRYSHRDNKNIETVEYENRHFTGASLFSVEGKTYLFDIDRREVKHFIFNPFLVELKKRQESIKAAYESLKPKEVVKAEKENKKVLRQGEWFFIPVKTPNIPKTTDLEKAYASSRGWGYSANVSAKEKVAYDKLRRDLMKKVVMPVQLRAGPNRPNNVNKGITLNGVTYVTGVVSHSGREHADLNLKQWYIAVANTSISSVTVTGDID